MNVPLSALARSMLAVLTLAVGLKAMKGQSDFWLGVLATLAAGWLLLAVVAAASKKGRDRAGWTASLLVASAMLALGFGPWSDIDGRGSAVGTGRYATLQPGSWLLLRHVYRYVNDGPGRARIATFDASGRPSFEVAVTTDRAGSAGDVEQLANDLDRDVGNHIAFFSSFRPAYATRRVLISPAADVFFHAGHLLLAMISGAVAGAIVSLAWPLGRRAVESETAEVQESDVVSLKVGDRVKIRNFAGEIGRIAELRGPLGPGGAPVYRVLVQRKPSVSYIELLGDQLEVVR